MLVLLPVMLRLRDYAGACIIQHRTHSSSLHLLQVLSLSVFLPVLGLVLLVLVMTALVLLLLGVDDAAGAGHGGLLVLVVFVVMLMLLVSLVLLLPRQCCSYGSWHCCK